MNQEFINLLLQEKVGNVLLNDKLAKYTTLNIGGNADIVVMPTLEEELSNIVNFCHKHNIPLTIIGNGSNLLIRDKGIRGVVVLLRDNFSNISVNGNIVEAQSGALLREVAKTSFENSLTGMEAVSGIPGSVGGAMVMNAGAYGTEMKDIVLSVRCLNQQGEFLEFSNEEMHFSYRHSKASDENLVVVSAKFELKPGNKEEIIKSFEDFDYKRSSKQPLDRYSAGSTFKRPEGYFASKLIDDAGLRGYTVGKAQVSEKHCGFLINVEDSTCENFLELVSKVQEKIFEQYGVTLEREVKLIGEE